MVDNAYEINAAGDGNFDPNIRGGGQTPGTVEGPIIRAIKMSAGYTTFGTGAGPNRIVTFIPSDSPLPFSMVLRLSGGGARVAAWSYDPNRRDRGATLVLPPNTAYVFEFSNSIAWASIIVDMTVTVVDMPALDGDPIDVASGGGGGPTEVVVVNSRDGV
jgi:hypothetical protein